MLNQSFKFLPEQNPNYYKVWYCRRGVDRERQSHFKQVLMCARAYIHW